MTPAELLLLVAYAVSRDLPLAALHMGITDWCGYYVDPVEVLA